MKRARIDTLTQTAPSRIWLQVDPNPVDSEDRTQPWPGDDGVMWCSDSIGGHEVEYIRADLALGKVAEGWVLVPKVPTLAMLDAPNTIVQRYAARLIWERMLAAAPTHKASHE